MGRTIYGTSKTKKPPPTIPPEMDVTAYLTRLVNTIVSIKDKTSKDAALVRMEIIASDIEKALDSVPSG